MMQNDSETILNKKIFRSFVIVTIILALFSSASDIIDSIFILSFYNEQNSAMAAKSISDMILLVLKIVPVILSVGAHKLYGIAIAKGKTKEASKIFSVTLLLTFFYSLIFAFINYFLSNQLVSALSTIDNPEFIALASSIVKGNSLGLPFMFINIAITSMLIIDGGVKTVIFSLFSTIIINLVGNYIVIYAFHGTIFHLFLVTSIAHLITTLINLSRLLSKKSCIKFSFHFKDLKILKTLSYKGSTGGVNHIATTLISLYMNSMLPILGGTIALEAWGIQQQFLLLINDFVTGFFKYSYLVISIYFADEDLKNMKQLLKAILKMIGYVIVPLCIFVSLLGSMLCVFNNSIDATYKTYLIVFIVSCSALIPFYSLVNIAIIYCEVKICYFIILFSTLIFPIIFSMPFFGLRDANLFVIGYAIGRSIYPFAHMLIVLIKYKMFPTDIKHLFFYKKDFGYNENDFLDIQIRSIVDCINISNDVREFCKNHNINKTKTNIIASCAEEIANMYVMSGFTIDRKKHYCSLRISIKNNDVKFRMRDDCPISLVNKFEEKIKNDQIYNISYKILINRAKDIKYSNFFKLNNFIISL